MKTKSLSKDSKVGRQLYLNADVENLDLTTVRDLYKIISTRYKPIFIQNYPLDKIYL